MHESKPQGTLPQEKEDAESSPEIIRVATNTQVHSLTQQKLLHFFEYYAMCFGNTFRLLFAFDVFHWIPKVPSQTSMHS